MYNMSNAREMEEKKILMQVILQHGKVSWFMWLSPAAIENLYVYRYMRTFYPNITISVRIMHVTSGKCWYIRRGDEEFVKGRNCTINHSIKMGILAALCDIFIRWYLSSS